MGEFKDLNKKDQIKKEIINLLETDIFLDKRKNFKLTEIHSWDSLKYINLVVIFEKYLNKKLKSEEIEKLLHKSGILKLLDK